MSSKVEPKFVRAPGFVARRVAGEVLLVQTSARSVQPIHRSTDLLVLNPTASRIWEALALPVDLDALAQYLIEDFEIEHGAARSDAEAFIASMIKIGAVMPATMDREQ